MVNKAKSEPNLVYMEPSKSCHPNLLPNEDVQKKQMYNLSRKSVHYFELKLACSNSSQEEFGAWSDVSDLPPPKELSTQAKPSKSNPKVQIRTNDNSDQPNSYRYFNDWHSHIIYYKQIKGYSNDLCLCNPEIDTWVPQQSVARSKYVLRSELHRQNTLPVVDSKLRQQHAAAFEKLRLFPGMASESKTKTSIEILEKLRKTLSQISEKSYLEKNSQYGSIENKTSLISQINYHKMSQVVVKSNDKKASDEPLHNYRLKLSHAATTPEKNPQPLNEAKPSNMNLQYTINQTLIKSKASQNVETLENFRLALRNAQHASDTQLAQMNSRVSKRKINIILRRSRDKVVTHSTGSLERGQDTNSSSHFPRVIREAYKLKVSDF